MPEGLRKFALTVHVTTSVAWVGAVAAFLALGIAGLTSHDPQILRAAAIAMKPIAWFAIAPLAIASPLTGIIQSIGTAWGLFRYYWVVMKSLITIPATSIFLLFHLRPIDRLASLAGTASASNAHLGNTATQIMVEAVVALVVLLAATVLSTYKPPGKTPFY